VKLWATVRHRDRQRANACRALDGRIELIRRGDTLRDLQRRARAGRALDVLAPPPAKMHEVVHAPSPYPFSWADPERETPRRFEKEIWASEPAALARR
jgi:hypothetical protein